MELRMVQSTMEEHDESLAGNDIVIVSSTTDGYYGMRASKSLTLRMLNPRFDALVRLSALGILPAMDLELERRVEEGFDSAPELSISCPEEMPSRESKVFDFLEGVWLVAEYKEGFVYGTAQDVISFDASARRKLDGFVSFRFLDPYLYEDIARIFDCWHSYHVLYSYKPTNPRRVRFESKQCLKDMLPAGHKGLVRIARRYSSGGWTHKNERTAFYATIRNMYKREPTKKEIGRYFKEHPGSYQSGCERFVIHISQKQKDVLAMLFDSPENFHKIANNLELVETDEGFKQVTLV